MQIVKDILKKAEECGEDPYLGMLAYHKSPIQTGLGSPAQLLMGRSLNSRIPALATCLQPQTPDHEEARAQLIMRKID